MAANEKQTWAVDEKKAGDTSSSDEETASSVPKIDVELTESTANDASPSPPPAVAAPPPEEGRTRLQTTIIMISLCSAVFLSALDVTIVTVAIPTISSHFKSTTGYTWIGSAYLLANAAAAPSWGKISDIWGRKQVLLMAVFIFWVGSLLSAISISMSMLIASRAIQGVGGGGIVVLVSVCISDLFSLRHRGQYFGLIGLVWAFAGGIGPIVGGVLTGHVTWRWCFFINLPISGVGFALLVFVLKLHNPRTSLRDGLAAIDWAGSLTVVGGTLMILLGLTFGGSMYPWRSAAVICLLIFGAVVVGLFIVIEMRFARFPVIPMRLFKTRAAVAAFGCCFFHGLTFISGTYYLPFYFQAVLGASPLMSGVYVLPFSLLISAGSSATGFAIRKTGKYKMLMVFGFVLLTIGFALFTILGSTISWGKCIMIQIVTALGVGINFQSPLIALQATVQQRDIASATATFGFIRQLATSISVVIGGVLFESGMQKQQAYLVASIGEEAASLLSGSNAAASVYLVDDLSSASVLIARQAYWNSLRTMYIMYAAFGGVGLITSLFIKQTTLSKVHEQRKTGLQGMKDTQDKGKQAGETSKDLDTELGDIKGVAKSE